MTTDKNLSKGDKITPEDKKLEDYKKDLEENEEADIHAIRISSEAAKV